MDEPKASPGASVAAKLAYRLYLTTMRLESMTAVSVRRRLLDAMLGRQHKSLFVFADVFIEDYGGLSLGDHVSVNRGSNLSAGGGLVIGDFVAIGHSTSILTSNHGFKDRQTPIKYQPIVPGPVQIGSNVWIGANVTILAGVRIADGTIIAAGSVVTKSITDPDTIVGGVPARHLKARFD